jgi:hypothetical protein
VTNLGSACRVASDKVHLATVASSYVIDLTAAAFQFEEDHGFEGVSYIGAARALVKRDQAGVDGIRLAWIDHALALGRGVQGEGAHQERVLQMSEVFVQGVLADRQSLGFESGKELLHTEGPRWVPEQVTLQPA